MSIIDKKYKISFLINPVSGGGQGKDVAEALPDIMTSMGYNTESWTWKYTELETQKDQIIYLLSNSKKLIAVGGDGTMSAVINEMSEEFAHGVELGLVPMGTGNDLARVLNIYDTYINRGILYLVRKLITAKSINFDLWTVNDKYVMASYVSLGSDAQAVQDFNSSRSAGKVKSHSSFGNKLYYLKYIAKNFFYKIPKQAIVEFKDGNDKWHKKDVSSFSSVIIANVPSFASGQNLFQDTKLDDKLVELLFMNNPFEFATALATANANVVGDIYKKSMTSSYHVKEVKITCPNPIPFQIDGEGENGKFKTQEFNVKYRQMIKILNLPENCYN